jgi:hypothetical protein
MCLDGVGGIVSDRNPPFLPILTLATTAKTPTSG